MSENLSSVRRESGRLAARRRLRRRRAFIALAILFLVLCAGLVYELNQKAVRISNIQVFGADQSLATLAQTKMQGSYFGLIPRDSIFFFPSSDIRAALSSANPDIAAISIFRNSFTSISIKVITRTPIALWCGAVPPMQSTSTPSVEPTPCYLFDDTGFVYEPESSSTQPLNSFLVYEPIPGTTASSSPLGVTLANAQNLPAAFDFARKLGTFGSPVSSVVFRSDDEVDDNLESGTRVTYVLGDEQNAYAALDSARSDFNLADGSVEYVDLRFDGKVYLKKK